jgi:hypothetical protein
MSGHPSLGHIRSGSTQSLVAISSQLENHFTRLPERNKLVIDDGVRLTKSDNGNDGF